MIKMQTEQATTGVVAVVRPSALAFARYEKTPNHSTDLATQNIQTPILGTLAWSPPV